MTDSGVRILIIDESDARARVLEEGLRDAGHHEFVRLNDTSDIVARVAAIDPDVILIDLENPKRDSIEQMFRVSRQVRRPIALFADGADAATIGDAVQAGVSAYVVDGLRRERVRGVVEVALARFRAFAELEERALMAERALEERKAIDRAKGLLMSRRGLSEQQAYDTLRRTARSRNRRIADVARSLLASEDLGL